MARRTKQRFRAVILVLEDQDTGELTLIESQKVSQGTVTLVYGEPSPFWCPLPTAEPMVQVALECEGARFQTGTHINLAQLEALFPMAPSPDELRAVPPWLAYETTEGWDDE